MNLVPKAASEFLSGFLSLSSVFSSDHLSLDGGKIHQNIHVSGTILRIIRVPEQVTGGFLNDATRSVKRVPVRILIISKFSFLFSSANLFRLHHEKSCYVSAAAGIAKFLIAKSWPPGLNKKYETFPPQCRQPSFFHSCMWK
jgi:hypothetical protein